MNFKALPEELCVQTRILCIIKKLLSTSTCLCLLIHPHYSPIRSSTFMSLKILLLPVICQSEYSLSTLGGCQSVTRTESLSLTLRIYAFHHDCRTEIWVGRVLALTYSRVTYHCFNCILFLIILL